MENKNNNKKDEHKHDNPVSQPDPETLHKTDPQENMKGPVSSLVNKTAEKIKENEEKDKKDEKEFEKKQEEKKKEE